MLTNHNHRYFRFFQKSPVFRRDHRSHKNNPVYRIILEQTHILYFLRRCIIRSGKQHLVIPLRKNLFDSCRNPADGFWINLWYNHPDQTRFLGSKHTRLRRWLIAGLINYFLNLFFLLVTDVSAVQVSRHRCAGYSCQFGNFFDRHILLLPLFFFTAEYYSTFLLQIFSILTD